VFAESSSREHAGINLLIVGEDAAGASEMSRAGDDSGISSFKSKGQGTRRPRNRDVGRPVVLAPLALCQQDAAEADAPAHPPAAKIAGSGPPPLVSPGGY
jgi:hypothetical protein